MFLITALVSFLTVTNAAQTWDDLSVTWDLSPFNSFAFSSLARQLRSDGTLPSNNYVQMENFCTISGSPFLGRRFRVKSNGAADPAVSLLFDVNGYIAGIQVSVLRSNFNPSNSIIQSQLAVADGLYVTQTAYFVSPNLICTSGRSASDFARDGTGTGLWVQQRTTTALSTPSIPKTQSALDAAIAAGRLLWTKGKCFYTMGLHYWYNLRTNMNCDDFLPMFLLYNKGKLNAYGWALDTGASPLSSPRFEHPTASVTFVSIKTFIAPFIPVTHDHDCNILQLFMNPIPACLSTDPRFVNLSTMHIFFTKNPRFNSYC